MAYLLESNGIVGDLFSFPFGSIESLKRLVENPLSLARLIPGGSFELNPLLSFNTAPNSAIEAIREVFSRLIPGGRGYVSPYDVQLSDIIAGGGFRDPVSGVVVPNRYEKIFNITITKIGCMLEDPLPSIKPPDSTRSLEETLRIGISPWWAPGLYFEPFIQQVPNLNYPPIVPSPVSAFSRGGIGPGYDFMFANLAGYYTDRNMTDREWVLTEGAEICRYNINGRFCKDKKPGRIDFPLSLPKFKDLRASNITPYTFLTTNQFGGICYEDIMKEYLRCSTQVIQYKNTEIKVMRHYYLVIVDSVIYPPFIRSPATPTVPSIILKTPFIIHQCVDCENDYAGIYKLLCAQKQVAGPCKGRNLNDLPEPPGVTEFGNAVTECFRTQRAYEEYVETLQTTFTDLLDANTDGTYQSEDSFGIFG